MIKRFLIVAALAFGAMMFAAGSASAHDLTNPITCKDEAAAHNATVAGGGPATTCYEYMWWIINTYNIPATACSGNKDVNYTSLETNPHVATYGDPPPAGWAPSGSGGAANLKQSYDIAGGTGYRYWGTNDECNNFAVNNPNFRPDYVGDPPYDSTNGMNNIFGWFWIYAPWNEVPWASYGTATWSQRQKMFSRILDKYNPPDISDPKRGADIGDFVWAPDNASTTGNWQQWLEDRMTTDHMNSEYSPGIATFYLHPRMMDGNGNWVPNNSSTRYDSFYIQANACIEPLGWTHIDCPPPSTFVDLELKPDLTLTPGQPGNDGSSASAIMVVHNSGNKDVPAGATFAWHWIDGPTEYQTLNFAIPAGQDRTIDLQNFKYMYYPGGTNTLYARVNWDKAISEKSATGAADPYANNYQEIPVTVNKPPGNAKVAWIPPTSVPLNQPLQLYARVNNFMPTTIELPCVNNCAQSNRKLFEYRIEDATGLDQTKLNTATITAPVIKDWTDVPGGATTIAADTLKDYNVPELLSDPAKTYRFLIRVPLYIGETNYGDNFDVIYLTPGSSGGGPGGNCPPGGCTGGGTGCTGVCTPPPGCGQACVVTAPPNTICRENGDMPSRMCIGYYPNFPSTVAEGGQGTYFFIQYFFFPEPMPAYTVQNKGTPKQTVTFNDKNNELGDTGRYLYYPTTSSTVVPGPFEAGPHGLFHYMYRGRMFADSVQFRFEVRDPMNAQIAKGTIDYQMPAFCKPNWVATWDKLDYKTDDPTHPECRTVTFYIPKSSANPGNTLQDYIQAPPEKDKIHFKNPGLHVFNFWAYENQRYYFQHDDGEEWQGLADGTGGYGPQKTPSIAGTTYTPQNQVQNHCYQPKDSYGKNTTASPVCYHDHNKDFHYWKFDWGKTNGVQVYNIDVPSPAP